MTSSQHGPYALGYTHATMAGTMGREGASRSQSHQSRPQLGSQAATRLRERGIASNRRSAHCGEYAPRPKHTQHTTGAAWLSSARAVRCWVKSRNERNPCR